MFACAIAPAARAFPTSRLVYARGPGAEQCPDQPVLRDAVASRLGYDPFFPSSDKTIVARILRDEKGLHGQVELVDEHGVQVGLRELTAEAEQCEQLVRAMALSISIAIDPKSAETYSQGPPDEPEVAQKEPPIAEKPVSEAPPESKTAAPANAAPANAAPAPTRPEQASTPRVLLSAGLGVMGVWHEAPTLTVAGLAFVRLRREWWSLALEGRGNWPVTNEQSNVSFRTSSFGLRALPCLHLGIAFACQVTSVGWISASGTALQGKSGSSAVLSLGARAGAELMLSRAMGVIAQAELLVSPGTVRLRSEDAPLWHSERLNGGAGLAAVLHFP